MKHINLSWLPCLILLASFFGCNVQKTTPPSSTASTSPPAAAPSTSGFQISQFTPAQGTFASLPAQVTITFNQLSLAASTDQGSVLSLANYQLICGGVNTYNPTAAVLGDSGTVILTLPVVPNLTAGGVCSLSVSPQVQDGSGNVITGNLSVNYAITPIINSAFQAQSFSPATSNQPIPPSSVQITFNESNLDLSAGPYSELNPASYSYVCGSLNLNPLSVTYLGNGAVNVILPAAPSQTDGTICTFAIAPTAKDAGGITIGGNLSAMYTIASLITSSLQISSSNPIAGNISALPGFMQITFSESNLDFSGESYSVMNRSNYSLSCGLVNYGITGVSYLGSGVIQLDLPSVALAAGSTCTLSVAPTIQDMKGYKLSGSNTVIYKITADDNLVWNEAALPTMTSSSSIYNGTGFYDKAQNGLALAGISINSGTVVDQLSGIWQIAFNPSAPYIRGPAHGGSGGSPQGPLLCPAGLQVTGVFGTYSNQIDSIGIICSNISATITYQSGAWGGDGLGNPESNFQLACPAGQFATDISGSSKKYLNQIELGCR